MRKEASLELWRELYQIADDIKKAKPWEVLFDTELLCIVPEGADEPVFVSNYGPGPDGALVLPYTKAWTAWRILIW